MMSYSPAGLFAQPRPLNAYSPCARTRLLSTARGDSSPQAHTACDQGVRTGTVGCTAIGASAPATHRRRLNGTRRSCVGPRREPLLSMADHGRACQATHADHRKGRTCRPKGGNPTRQAARRLAPETRLMCLIEQAAGVLCRSLRLRMASTRRPGVDTFSRCPHVLRGPRRLWSRWPLRAARASVSRHASAGHHGSAVRACLGSYRARAHSTLVRSRQPQRFFFFTVNVVAVRRRLSKNTSGLA